MEDLARELGERRRARDSTQDDDLMEAFEAVDVDEVDTDELWQEVFDEGTDLDGNGAGPTEAIGEVGNRPSDGVGDPTDPAAARDADTTHQTAVDHEHIVSKHEYCQRCPHFSDPPDTVCTHEGTDIVEVVTVDRFRVRNCPMVDDG